jgi:hypothetical protein
LPTLWADSGRDSWQALVTAIFDRLDVLRLQRLEHELMPDAIDFGLDAALPPSLELDRQIGGFGRGERSRTAISDLSVHSRGLRCAVFGAARWLARTG